jgi:hypothetical protein
MSASFTYPEPHPESAVPRDLCVVAEFAHPPAGRFKVADLDTLIYELAAWQPSGLWCDDRYAIQLHVAASSLHEALRVALDGHYRALVSGGLTASRLIRAEVVTAEEMERGWEELSKADRHRTRGDGASGGHSPQVYAALRGLVAATTVGEVGEVVDRFVVAIGARVQVGAALHLPVMIDVDLNIDGGRARHATAEAFSMAGLFLEQALPDFLADARRALDRLQPQLGRIPGTASTPTEASRDRGSR